MMALPICKDSFFSKEKSYAKVLSKFTQTEKKGIFSWLQTVGRMEIALKLRKINADDSEQDEALEEKETMKLRRCANLHWRLFNLLCQDDYRTTCLEQNDAAIYGQF